MSKRLSKYIASFDYLDKSLIVLSATSGSTSIASIATVIVAPVGTAIASLNFAFLIIKRIVKNILKTTRNKNEKHNKIFTLAKSELNSIDNKIFEALINNEISHEDLTTNINNRKKISKIPLLGNIFFYMQSN